MRWIGVAAGLLLAMNGALDQAWAAESDEFTQAFRLKDCTFSPAGGNPYFSLKVGRTLTLEGDDGGELVRVVITVLGETENITFETPEGEELTVRTRIIEEHETVNGAVKEISRNFYARCQETSDIYYFGEEVDIFLEDGTVVHDGAWRAGVDGAQPGIIMPGTFLLGARYYQEVAPGVAEDRAEHEAMGLVVEVLGQVRDDCVEVVETTPLERRGKAESIKMYCPGLGLVYDDGIVLVEFLP
jgi:hypothetical protein